eukprot:365009-Prymnesium_polylepis.1
MEVPILYMACQVSATACLKALLLAGADAMHEYTLPGAHHRDTAITPLQSCFDASRLTGAPPAMDAPQFTHGSKG